MNDVTAAGEQPATEHVDVLIVGAGISGIGAAHHLAEQCPTKSFVILDNKADYGGTWRQHTYPGIRSDSDLYTFGYRFKPWLGAPIASGAAILKYLQECVEDDDLTRHIRYQHDVRGASWDSDLQHWRVKVRRTDTNEVSHITCGFFWMCGGYYQHAKGYTPEWQGMDDFKGQIVHPQTWPDDLDYTGKRVVVIGSGATAATLIPNMADDCAHITMLLRSPTYFGTAANRDELADTLRALDVPDEWIHDILRRSKLKETRAFQDMTATNPEQVKKYLLDNIATFLDDDFDMSHFTPSYRLWQQRLAYVPDGDLFKAIKSGKASVVTDHIERFVPEGILTQTGKLLEADIVITATGFNASVMGDIDYDVDGKPVDFSQVFTYRGLMNSGVPNMSFIFGYLRTTYTIRVELLCDFVCRLLNHMDARGAAVCTPTLGEADQNMTVHPWIDREEFNPSYLLRALPLMPKRGDHAPWLFNTDYYVEREELPTLDLDEEALVYQAERQTTR